MTAASSGPSNYLGLTWLGWRSKVGREVSPSCIDATDSFKWTIVMFVVQCWFGLFSLLFAALEGSIGSQAVLQTAQNFGLEMWHD